MARPSSFLDGFLSDRPEEAPHNSAPEDAKISDRSAFDKQTLSIEEIVAGSGVSDIASFPVTRPAEATRTRPAMYPAQLPQRESAIPISPPKKFNGLGLASFPDRPERATRSSNVATDTSKRNQIQPTTYSTGTFSTFRTLSTSVTKGRRSMSTTSRLYLSQILAQRSESPRPINQHSKIASKRPPVETKPNFPPRKMTDMSPAELNKNPRFQSMARRYTALIVGIPVLLVSTYLLYQRVNLLDEENKSSNQMETQRKVERVRGVIPVSQPR